MQASRLLLKDKVWIELERRLARYEVTADRVVAELAKLGFANMADYIDTRPDGGAFINFSQLTRDQAAAIQEITSQDVREGSGRGVRQPRPTRLKLGNKVRALELLGKHLRLFTEEVDLGRDTELAELLKAGRARVAQAGSGSVTGNPTGQASEGAA
jgi:phage terminase small subunit